MSICNSSVDFVEPRSLSKFGALFYFILYASPAEYKDVLRDVDVLVLILVEVLGGVGGCVLVLVLVDVE